jgi:hypothetical protein
VGTNGTVWWTTNLKNWTQIRQIVTNTAIDVFVDFANQAWVTTAWGGVWRGSPTTTFAQQPTDTRLHRIVIAPNGRSWAIASDGTVLVTQGAAGVWQRTPGVQMQDISTGSPPRRTPRPKAVHFQPAQKGSIFDGP